MSNLEILSQDEKELIVIALQVSKRTLHNVYTKDWLKARIHDIENKLQTKATSV